MSVQTTRGSGYGKNATIEDIRNNRIWFMIIGALLIVLGAVAVLFPYWTTMAAQTVIGWLFIAGGLVQFLHAFSAEGRTKFALGLILGILYVAVGVWLAFFPNAAMVSLTVILAATFVVQGVIEIGMAMKMRSIGRWVWMAFSGIVAIAAGVLIVAGLPSTAVWAIGLLVGINLLSSGIAYLLLALAVGR